MLTMKCIFKITLFVIVVLCCLNPLSAQEEKNTEYAVKLYYNYQPEVTGYFTPSLLILKPKASHEFELSRLRIRAANGVDKIEDDSGQDTVSGAGYNYNFTLGLKYEYGFKFLTIDEKFNFSLHASAEPYFGFFKTNIRNDGQRLSRRSLIGGRLNLIPRVIYDIDERWFVDVNFPLEMMNVSRAISHHEILDSERSSIQNDFYFLNNVLRMRVGIGLKL